MTLPCPNDDDVKAFRALYNAKFSLELSSEEALDVATKALHLYYVKHHAILHLRKEELGK
jgi:hypothetical protein